MDVDPRHYNHVAINDNEIHNIVVSYLVHNCYKETVESFVASTGMKQPAVCLDDMDKRKRIFRCAVEGDALKAIELTEELAPDLLENDKDLHLDLLSLHFVELVCSKKCTEALEFAQNKLTPFGKVKKYVAKLEDFMALLAYEEPEKSPMFHLLSLDYRQQVADSLNRAILAHSNLPSYTAMERLIQQTTVVRQSISEDNAKVSAVGQPAVEVSVELILRVVADVGLVGLPNAGKSTLLAATTLARPDIADYPFTTLMPNLGDHDGDPSLGPKKFSSEATLAGLSGLMGLGRNFLRHLRRTRLLVHVVDATTENPVNDYRTAKDRLASLTEEIMRLGIDRASIEPEMSSTSPGALQPLSSEGRNADVISSKVPTKTEIEDYPRLLAIVGVSVLEGITADEMLVEIRAGLRKCQGV